MACVSVLNQTAAVDDYQPAVSLPAALVAMYLPVDVRRSGAEHDTASGLNDGVGTLRRGPLLSYGGWRGTGCGGTDGMVTQVQRSDTY
jgi:hypothetical protein